MKLFFVAVSLVLYGGQLAAQVKPKFSTQNYVGIVAGSRETELQVQTINGLSYKKWFTGIGSGIDWYFLRSIPVFVSAERSISITAKRKLYFSSAAGANFPWKNEGYYNYYWGWDASKMYPGFYWNAGFGYKIAVGKQNDAILFHLGYSNKFYKEKVTSVYPCLIPPCPENTETFKYNLRALSLKLGWGF